MAKASICLEKVGQLLVLSVLGLHRRLLLIGDHRPLCVRPVLADHHEVETKIASSETIIVNSPNGYFSTPSPIQSANHATWIYTKVIDPANAVILSATRFCTSWARSSEMFHQRRVDG